jgi:hypothetical protein
MQTKTNLQSRYSKTVAARELVQEVTWVTAIAAEIDPA